ncbi:hypothetical protein B0J11DRAFT_575005 [Dendryphion nanum]|uniref:Uncharacterized protein n=1 Tax=Dendryphion nanum TaxID=256645 RepID=A0A9P9EL74_9PLEO|nr:hypothetical protein B0J11DRAFT_575005 [Dendryphion nanum]
MFSLTTHYANIISWNRNRTVYASLGSDLSPSSDNEDQRDELGYNQAKPTHNSSKPLHYTIICLLILTNILTLTNLAFNKFQSIQSTLPSSEYTPKSAARVQDLPTQWKRLNWWTSYSDINSTSTQSLWDAINYSHGIIAVDHAVADAQNWPNAMRSPKDSNKKVYLLEGYHLLHCITVVRKSFWEALHSTSNFTFEPQHAGHCIDQLRQYVICKADNTPLYSFGTLSTGDEQYRKCRSWDALREFATENSACYRETPEGVDEESFGLEEHFGYCDGGYDGVRDGERRGRFRDGAVHRPE